MEIAYQNNDIILKYMSEAFRDTALSFYGLDTAKIKAVISTELPVLEGRGLQENNKPASCLFCAMLHCQSPYIAKLCSGLALRLAQNILRSFGLLSSFSTLRQILPLMSFMGGNCLIRVICKKLIRNIVISIDKMQKLL